jgi:hypothetical protein
MNIQTTGLAHREAAVRRGSPASPRAEARSFLLRSTQKVADHYRHLLTTHSLSETERHAILLRLEKQERLLRELAGAAHTNSGPSRLDI